MSTTLNIRLTDEQRAALTARATECGYSSVEAYVGALVEADAGRIEYGSPTHLRPGRRRELEALVREGANSPARELAATDWHHIRQLNASALQ